MTDNFLRIIVECQRSPIRCVLVDKFLVENVLQLLLPKLFIVWLHEEGALSSMLSFSSVFRLLIEKELEVPHLVL